MRLPQQSIEIDAPGPLCFEVVAAAGKRLERRSDGSMVVEFVTKAVGRDLTTVELVTPRPPDLISYEWLDGPLDRVTESIEVAHVSRDRARLTHRGEFAPLRGPLGALASRLLVRPLFARAVKSHLSQAKDVAERRAARSKVHRAPARPRVEGER